MSNLMIVLILINSIFLPALKLVGAEFDSGIQAFQYLHKVASSPRCMNCHGQLIEGEHRPTIGDQNVVHPMNISAKILTLGHRCTTCHGIRNLPILGTPPGAGDDNDPNREWRMPPKEMIINNNVSIRDLCLQWTNNTLNGNRGDLKDFEKFRTEFLDHFENDALIQWTFNPGLGRSPSPGSLAMFKEAAIIWIDWLAAGNSCANL